MKDTFQKLLKRRLVVKVNEYTGSELRLSLTYSILEAKCFSSEGEALVFLETDKFKNVWRWNPVFSILKHYFIKKVEIEFFEKITKAVTV